MAAVSEAELTLREMVFQSPSHAHPMVRLLHSPIDESHRDNGSPLPAPTQRASEPLALSVRRRQSHSATARRLFVGHLPAGEFGHFSYDPSIEPVFGSADGDIAQHPHLARTATHHSYVGYHARRNDAGKQKSPSSRRQTRTSPTGRSATQHFAAIVLPVPENIADTSKSFDEGSTPLCVYLAT